MKIKLQVVCLVVLSIIAFTCGMRKDNQKPEFNPHPIRKVFIAGRKYEGHVSS